ncbi:1-acylglycerol-3-phosphate O-acyltransferase PNPLA3-like isoform X2 [Lepus europaeus]|uniref:1-acylglycerol-3-phosphate O-acyltransferase PNPLA3-like isoform X2 n=1 Tax=Lepus europaeus TaxID=9983 RepID=UPI002B4768B1|nr:1-acylglycerol-3-phosphate O-acyltransferase PNPLA3-like isoform X2 [Lepus europaeus]
MYDPERGWSLSFAGCGFMGFYHVGATRCLSEHAPHLLRDARMLLGCSAGALHCVAFLCGMPLDKILQVLMDMAREARRRNIGILHPSFNLGRYIRNQLQLYLPANVHQIVSGRVSISLTRVSDGENVLVSDFHSKEEVVDRYMDGGASDNIPSIDARTTITVSPFYGEHDICPKVKSTNFLHVNITNLSLRLCLGNVYLMTRAIFPPDVKVLGEICVRGYLDAFRFLEENGICSRPQHCLSLLPTEPAPEAHAPHGEGTSREPSPGPEGDELLEHLRASILPWDDGVLQTMSPRLTAVLNETIKDRGGYLSKICNLLPVRVVSYVMLPCTLPVESAIAAVRGLVLWLPDLPDDVQWLQWLVSQMFARLTSCLLPASRSQRRMSGQHAALQART